MKIKVKIAKNAAPYLAIFPSCTNGKKELLYKHIK